MKSFAFVLKKLVGTAINPLALELGIIAVGLWRWRRGRRGWWVVMAGGVFIAVMAMPAVGRLWNLPLERAAGAPARVDQLRKAGVKLIVVLGGGVNLGPYSLVDRLTRGSLERVIEAIRLWKGLGGGQAGIRLVLSGGNARGGITEARAMAEVARMLGVEEGAMVLEEGSWDTEDEARALRRVLKDKPFALVTTARHMPRAMVWFTAAGLRPIPAPTGFTTLGPGGWGKLVPGPGGLQATASAWYEYLGLSWAKLKLWARDEEGSSEARGH